MCKIYSYYLNPFLYHTLNIHSGRGLNLNNSFFLYININPSTLKES